MGFGQVGMNNYNMTQRPKLPPDSKKQSKPTDAAFDIWLNRGLHQMFDKVASEPIPDELMKLIEEDRKK